MVLIYQYIHLINIMKFKQISYITAILLSLYTKNIFATFTEHQDGIINNIINTNKIIYLTFDACGGKSGSQLDMKIINFLKKNKIKSTLFVTSKFILYNNNIDTIKELDNSGYFNIQNHGKNHKPASINGKTIYGIKGTRNIEELKEEILHCNNLIYKIINKIPNWYRSGTAYYDTEAIQLINDLQLNIAGFAIAIDGGATFKKDTIVKNMKNAKNGDILLIHINHPEKQDVRNGVIKGIKYLKKQGYNFEFLP